MNKIYRFTVLAITFFFMQPIFSIGGKIYNYKQVATNKTTRYGLSFENKSSEDVFIVVENYSLSKSEAKMGSLRYFSSKTGKSLAMTPVFKAGSVINKNHFDKDGNYYGQYPTGVNIDMDINSLTTISIYTYNRSMSATQLPHVTMLDQKEIGRSFLPGAKLLCKANFKPEKTMYVKWDGKKLTPQKGSLFGVSNAGFSLQKNVTQKDIMPA